MSAPRPPVDVAEYARQQMRGRRVTDDAAVALLTRIRHETRRGETA